MSSTGVSIAYLVTCLAAAKLFSFNQNSQTYGPVYKVFAIIGSIFAFIFLLLLLLPFSPASLSMPSYIALGGWTILGLVFFFIRLPKLRRMDKDELTQLILDTRKRDVEKMIEE